MKDKNAWNSYDKEELQSWKNYVKLIVNFWMQEKRSGNV